MNQTHETLVKARALIEKPENWITGRLYNYQRGYCAVGAVMIASGHRYGRMDSAIGALARHVNPSSLPAVDPAHGPWRLTGDSDIDNNTLVVAHNNTMGHACVLELFDAAIEATA